MQHTTGVVLRNVQTEKLHVEEFSSSSQESWCLLGDNRSGVETFVQIISGGIQQENADQLYVSEEMAVVSFKAQQELFEAEVRKDDSDFLNRVDPGTLAREFLGPWADELLTFTRGLSENDEPDLWQKSLDGRIERWIEVGEPSLDRLNHRVPSYSVQAA